MKKRNLAVLGLVAVSALGVAGLTSCDKDSDKPSDVENNKTIVLTGTKMTVTVADAAKLDVKSLFTISLDGAPVTVTDDMLSLGGFTASEGTYQVKLTYEGQTATSIVTVVNDNSPVTPTKNVFTLSSTNMTVLVSDVASLDLKTLFSLKKDGTPVEVTDAMISGEVKAEAGSYTITLSYEGQTATSIVTVAKDGTTAPDTKVLKVSGTNKTVVLEDAGSLNLKTLFTIEFDGTPIAVTDAMITGEVKAEVGSYTITLSYEGQTVTSIVEVVENFVELRANNQVIEVGAIDDINPRELFTITENNEPVNVLNSMITGEILPEVGTYDLVLNYGGKSITCTVKVVDNYDVSILTNTEALIVTRNDASFDLKNVFSIYIGKTELPITDDMIRAEDFDISSVGNYNVQIDYTRYGIPYHSEATIQVLPVIDIQTPKGDKIELAGVYSGNDAFKYDTVFKAYADGIEIPFVKDNLDSNIVFDSSNLAQGGEYDVTYTISIQGKDYSKTVHYVIYSYDVSIDPAATTSVFCESELTVDKNPLEFFNIKINTTSVTLPSCKCLFVESSKVDETEVPEGKTLVPYTLTNNIVYGTTGTYDVSIHFELEGRSFEESTQITIVDDVKITAKNPTTVSILAGADAYDYKTLFKVQKYNPEKTYNKYDDITVTDEMIDDSKVNLTTPGTYEVVCTYEGVSFTVEVVVVEAPFLGSYTATDDSGKTLTINHSSVTYNDGTEEKTGTLTVDGNDIKMTITGLSGIVKATYLDGLLIFDREHVTVTSAESIIYAKDIDAWTKREATNISSATSSGYKIFEFTNKADAAISHTIVLDYEYSYEYDYTYYEYVYNCSATFYVDPEVTGTLFDEGSATITLGTEVVKFDFAADGSFTANSSTVTPPDLDGYEGSYTGAFGALELDGKGNITVTDSEVIVPNYNGVKYTLVGDQFVLSWRDDSYASHFKVISLNQEDYTYLEAETDGFERNYAYSSYVYFNFLGNGIVETYSVFKYGQVFANYTVDGSTVTVTSDDLFVTLELTNGENDARVVAKNEDSYLEDKYDVFKVPATVAYNYKVSTISDIIEIGCGNKLTASDVFKIEYMEGNELKTLSPDPYADLSVVDFNTVGYYSVMLRFKSGDFEYVSSAIIHVYPVPYKGFEEVGVYRFEHYSNSSYYDSRLELNEDGTALYYDYNEKNGTWCFGEDGFIYVTCGSTVYTVYYNDGTILLSYNDYSGVKFMYGFKNATFERLYSADNKKLYVVKNSAGVVEYYFIDGATAHGQVNALFAAKELADGVIVQLMDGDNNELLEAKISGSNSFVYAGPEKGSFSTSGSSSQLVLDGFGNATYGSDTGTYEIIKGYYKVDCNGTITYFDLNIDEKIYTVVDASVILAGETKEYAIEVNEGEATAALDSTLDTVWYKFTATLSGEYTIYSNSDPSNYVDNKGYLYDEADTQLAFVDDKGDAFVTEVGGHKYDFGFKVNLTKGTIYYIKVTISSPKSSKYDGYNLNIVVPTPGAEAGTYTGENGTIILDGFGVATMDDSSEVAYKVYSDKILILAESGSYVLDLNKEANTYIVSTDSILYDNSSTYTFVLNDGVYTSNNQNVNSSSATLSILALKNVTISFKFKISSEANYDKFTVMVNGVEVDGLTKLSGTVDYSDTATTITLQAGDTLTFQYSKDSSGQSGDDAVCIKEITVTENN